MRLIDADSLKTKVEAMVKHRTIESDYDFGGNQAFDYVADILIDDAPTVSAVQVVRCKDCRFFKKIVERSDSGICHRDIVASAWKENGYCSRGERKGGDNNETD